MKNCFRFLSFKDVTHEYLVKISMTHEKHLTPRFFEDNDLISAKSDVHILSTSHTFFSVRIF